MFDDTSGTRCICERRARRIARGAVDPSGRLPTYRPSSSSSRGSPRRIFRKRRRHAHCNIPYCARAERSETLSFVSHGARAGGARARAESRRAKGNERGGGGQGWRGYGALRIRAWVCERRPECAKSVRGVPCKYLTGIGGVTRACARLRKRNGKGGLRAACTCVYVREEAREE